MEACGSSWSIRSLKNTQKFEVRGTKKENSERKFRKKIRKENSERRFRLCLKKVKQKVQSPRGPEPRKGTMPSALPVLSHTGERLCEIDSTDLRNLSCIHARLPRLRLARLLSDAADAHGFAQVAMSKRVTQAIVGGDSFLIPNQGIGASPYSRSSLSSRPVGTEEDPGAVCPVTLMPDSSRVAMDYATGDLYVFYDDRRVTIGPGSGVFLPHVHTDVLIRGNESTRVVFVHTLTGKKLSLVVLPTDTIEGVMNKILEQEAIPLDQWGFTIDRQRSNGPTHAPSTTTTSSQPA